MSKLIKISVIGFLFCITFQTFGFDVIGHRGVRGLIPENTIEGIEKAIELNVDYIDLDIVMTADGVLVVYHDLVLNPNLTRAPSGKWINSKNLIPVSELSLSELKRYNVGQIRPHSYYAKLFPRQKGLPFAVIPTLKEAIDIIKTKGSRTLRLQIEIKSDPYQLGWNMPKDKMIQTLAELLASENMIERTKVQAFDWRYLLLLRQYNPNIETAYLTNEKIEQNMHALDPAVAGMWSAGYLLKDYHHSIPEMIKSLGGQWWDAQNTELTEDKIDAAHALGLKVSVWFWPERHPSHETETNIPYFIALGVDAIITDHPEMYFGIKR